MLASFTSPGGGTECDRFGYNRAHTQQFRPMLKTQMLPELQVDLRLSPEKRWSGLAQFRDAARELVTFYLNELEGFAGDGLFDAALPILATQESQNEMRGIADVLGVPFRDIALVNLYYDAFRALFGCTALGLDTPAGPILARNLDWWTSAGALSRLTQITHTSGGPAGPFSLVGWPGFVGAFSGSAPGRFALTLNAVASNEGFCLTRSTPLFLRDMLESAPDYDTAKSRLESELIASDCLLLLVGVRPGELCVIERTSRRSATREAEGGVVAATNAYRTLVDTPTQNPGNGSILADTACSRYDRALAMAAECKHPAIEDCFSILSDPSVRMKITVQHMVMQPAIGLLEYRMPL